jgi:hypothetical protein
MPIDHPRRSAGEAVPDPSDAPELLGVEVDQLAGPLALVTHHHRLCIEHSELAQAPAAQDGAHRRDRHLQLPRDRRAAQPLVPQTLDLADRFVTDAVPAASCRRAAVGQRRRATAAVARQPAIALPLRDPGRVRRLRYRPAMVFDPLRQQESTWRGQPRVLVNVHPGDPPIIPVSVVTHSVTGLRRVNNLHSNDT